MEANIVDENVKEQTAVSILEDTSSSKSCHKDKDINTLPLILQESIGDPKDTEIEKIDEEKVVDKLNETEMKVKDNLNTLVAELSEENIAESMDDIQNEKNQIKAEQTESVLEHGSSTNELDQGDIEKNSTEETESLLENGSNSNELYQGDIENTNEEQTDSILEHANISKELNQGSTDKSNPDQIEPEHKSNSNDLKKSDSEIKHKLDDENQRKQDAFNATIENIISDIDTNIAIEEQTENINELNVNDKKNEQKTQRENKVIEEITPESEKDNLSKINYMKKEEEIRTEEKNIAALKQQELELLKKHEELNLKIQQQQLLAKTLIAENEKTKNEMNKENILSKIHTIKDSNSFEHFVSESKDKQSLNNNVFKKYDDIFSNSPQVTTNKDYNSIDLQKIYTPATDNVDILPKRKLFASSAFYSPHLHPTVEDQLELARKISSSLSDTCNHTSKGQDMYVNRKKRSVKWVHEATSEESSKSEMPSDETLNQNQHGCTSVTNVLHLVMNPRGQVIDYKSARENMNIETGLLSPDKCAELTYALKMQKGKGAELFAKRRKKVDKWIKDQYNISSQSPSGIADDHQNNEQIKYPHNCAKNPMNKYLNTIITPKKLTDNEKKEENLSIYTHKGATPIQLNAYDTQGEMRNNLITAQPKQPFDSLPYDLSSNSFPLGHKTSTSNTQRELAYMPSIPKGWNAPSVPLPKELYIPKEIPLKCYAPPPSSYNKFPLTYEKPGSINSFNIFCAPKKPTENMSTTLNNNSRNVQSNNYRTKPSSHFISPATNAMLIENSNITSKKNELANNFAANRTSTRFLAKNNFNNAARGWNSQFDNTFNAKYGFQNYKEEMPYTDF